MADPIVDLFCEDTGHELLARSLITRLARETGLRLRIYTQSAVGGRGRAITQLEAYQRAISKGYLVHPIPDLLVIIIDANDVGPSAMEQRVREKTNGSVFPRIVIGCPDPHVERWCFADPQAFMSIVGAAPPPEPQSLGPGGYKELLERSILQAGQTIATTPMEFAPDLIDAMDLFRAGKNQPSLKRFVEGLRDQLSAIANRA